MDSVNTISNTKQEKELLFDNKLKFSEYIDQRVKKANQCPATRTVQGLRHLTYEDWFKTFGLPTIFYRREHSDLTLKFTKTTRAST